MISLESLNKADVLAALYNASKPLGMGFMHYDPKPMTSEEAQEYLNQTTYFDYLKGRVMKVELKDDELDPCLYDRDNGEGAAWRAIEALRATGNANDATTQDIHKRGTLASADVVNERMHSTSELSNGVLTIGLADVAEKLGPKIEAAKEKLKNQ